MGVDAEFAFGQYYIPGVHRTYGLNNPSTDFFCNPVILKSICYRTRAYRPINESNKTKAEKNLDGPWHHLQKWSSWVGNPGRPPHVTPLMGPKVETKNHFSGS